MKYLSLALALLALSTNAMAARPLDELRAEFTKHKFGMFIHFNMATFHEIEWAQGNLDLNTFNPKSLDIGQWADAAASAGMKYAVLTTKHHDGFCLWDSAVTKYDVASTPIAGRDLVKEFCDEFRKRGIEPHLYYSIWDRTEGIQGKITPEEMKFIKTQLTELLTQYGTIRSLTFDGWGQCGTEWTDNQYKEIYDHIKSLQPETLVTDHYLIWRVYSNLDRYKKVRLTLDEAYRINDILHFEEPCNLWAPEGNTCASQQGPKLQSKWFWKESFPGEPLLSVEAVVNKRLMLLDKRNCNLLLNVAPNPDGLLDENVLQRLKEVGEAYRKCLAKQSSVRP